jgi:hypothetical protein
MNLVGISHSYSISQSQTSRSLPIGAVPSPAGFNSLIDEVSTNANESNRTDSTKKKFRKSFKSVKQMAQYILIMIQKYNDIKAQAPQGKVNFEKQKELMAVLDEIEDIGKGDRPPVSNESISMIV